MSDFSIALPITLAFEGGYVDDPKDPGGETNLGITLRVFSTTAHPLLGIEPTSDNLKNLQPAQAGIIYRANYWNAVRGDDIILQELANILFDFYVNSGTHASSLLQKVVNNMGAAPPVVVDGNIGQKTIDCLSALPQAEVYREFKAARLAFYQELGKKYPEFVDGWVHRVESFPDLAAS